MVWRRGRLRRSNGDSVFGTSEARGHIPRRKEGVGVNAFGLRHAMFSRRDINRTEVEQVRIGIVAVDFKDFGNETAAGTALDLNYYVQRVADICFDGGVRKLYAAL